MESRRGRARTGRARTTRARKTRARTARAQWGLASHYARLNRQQWFAMRPPCKSTEIIYSVITFQQG